MMRTLPMRFFEQAGLLSDRILFAARQSNGWETMTWSDAQIQVEHAMRALREAGIEPGDRVLLLAENRPEWAIFDLAIMAVGALVVPAYTTHTVHDLQYILQLTTPTAAFVSSAELTDRVLAANVEADTLKQLWSAEPEGIEKPRWHTQVSGWRDILNSGKSDSHDPDIPYAAKPDDPCCLIFTSGTGGHPKAAILTHRSIGSNVDAAAHILRTHGFGADDRFLSFLPLAHAYEHTAGLHLPISLGAEVWYCDSTDKLQTYLGEVRPTLATAVPRLYDLLYSRIQGQVRTSSGLKSKLFHSAVSIGLKKLDQAPLTLLERLIDPVLDRLVRQKVRARFGGRLRFFISGGAPLNPDVGRFFTSLGLGILQGYGQTEASPLISVNTPDANKLHTVGKPFPGVDIRVADDGELVVRGDLVMQGYWNDPLATEAVLRDGWLHTGDLARIDEDGFIEIIGRKKDLLITSGGDNIAPAKLEALLTLQDEIDQAVVIGDRRPWLSAILVPAAQLLETTTSSEQCIAALEHALKRVNDRLGPTEKIRKFIVHQIPFSTDNGLLTPTQKVRRQFVIDALRVEIDQLYRGHPSSES